MPLSSSEKARRRQKRRKERISLFSVIIVPENGGEVRRFNLYRETFLFFWLILFSLSAFAGIAYYQNKKEAIRFARTAEISQRERLKLELAARLRKKINNFINEQVAVSTAFLKATLPESDVDSGKVAGIGTVRRAMEFLYTLESNYQALPLGRPSPGFITSTYGSRISPFGFTQDFHTGVDFANGTGMPIYATAPGKVIHAGGNNSGYGLYVRILHKNGFITLYGHSSKVEVELDDMVRRGQEIALTGQTGSATGPHLHYEIRLQEDDPVSPYEYTLNPIPFINENPGAVRDLF